MGNECKGLGGYYDWGVVYIGVIFIKLYFKLVYFILCKL